MDRVLIADEPGRRRPRHRPATRGRRSGALDRRRAARGVERVEGVAEVAGLGGAAGRAGSRVEVDDNFRAAEVAQRNAVAVGIGQGERGGYSANFECHSTRIARLRGIAFLC